MPVPTEGRAEKPVVAGSVVVFAEVEAAALRKPLNSSWLTLENTVINCNPVHLQGILYYCLHTSS